MKLLFSERLKKYRHLRNLTQEQLAAAITISPQSVSKWERGDGYPDITLLPRIANFFEISIDELLGNDEATRAEDVKNFTERFCRLPNTREGHADKLALAKEYYRKYPSNFDVMDMFEDAIVKNMDKIGENMALLGELHEKIMSGSTVERMRRDSIHRMCCACPDSELEERIGNSELDWSEAVCIGELCEERYLLRSRFDEYRRERNVTDLIIFMQYLGRKNMQYFGSESDMAFDEPERTAAWELHKLRLLESFSDDGVPEAWCGCYAEFTLKAAGALIGCGRLDEGFALLEKAIERYPRWLAIPTGALMDAGCPEAFSGARISKWANTAESNYSVYIYTADGKKTWTPYMWLFWQLPSDVSHAMTHWRWFDGARNDARYAPLLERANALSLDIDVQTC